MNKLILFFLIGLYSDFVRFKRRLVMNWLYCFLLTVFIWRRIVIEVGLVIFLVFRTIRFLFFFRKGLLKFLIVVIRDFTFLKNDIWKFFCILWWFVFWISIFVVIEFLNSFISFVIFGFDIIYRRRVLGFLVRFIVLIFFLIILLFCLCVWSIVIVENRFGVLWIANNFFLNWRKIFGVVCWSVFIFRRWTGS